MTPLPEPARYFPLHRGRFEVTPGLSPLTTDFGNGERDTRLFQIDRDFDRFRANTVAARVEDHGKYVLFDPRFDTVHEAVCRAIIARLVSEYPDFFTFTVLPTGRGMLECRLTGERLGFDRSMRLTAAETKAPIEPAYANAFDALLAQVPEDMAVVALPEGAPDANIALHVTAPSHWAPGEKIGASFTQTHAPVPHFERIARASDTLMRTLLTRPPFVRFNWGIEFTDRLNLHPDPTPGADPAEWNRRVVRASDPCPLYLRLERQTLWGISAARVILFGIRVYVLPITALFPEERDAVQQTLRTMPAESRSYKGLPPETFAMVDGWLAGYTAR